jgi:ankyrin repeat protein
VGVVPFGGVNMDLGVRNVGDYDLAEVTAIADNGLSIARGPRQVLYATILRESSPRGNYGVFADNRREVPRTFTASWSEVHYQGNDANHVPRSATISVAERIPEDVIRAARGGRGDRLAIVLCIGGDRAYLQWALWPRPDGGPPPEGGRKPLRVGGDDIPPPSASLSTLHALVGAGSDREKANALLRDAASLGVDLNSRIKGTPLLHWVLGQSSDGWYASRLLELGADPMLRGLRGNTTSLMLAAGNTPPYLLKTLLARGGDVHERDAKGRTALHYAVTAGRADNVTMLLARGADPNALDPTHDSETPLMLIAGKGPPELVRALLDGGADVDARSKYGVTAVMLAAGNGPPELVKMLLDRGANVHARNVNGGTALHYAASAGNTENIKLLLARGADPNIANQKGETPLRQAELQGFMETAAALKSAGGK